MKHLICIFGIAITEEGEHTAIVKHISMDEIDEDFILEMAASIYEEYEVESLSWQDITDDDAVAHFLSCGVNEILNLMANDN